MKMYVPERSIFVVPVPISNTKLRIRGYNQSCTIAKAFCDCADKGVFELKDNVIFKKIETTPQAKISNRKQRLENIRGVFEIKNSRIVKGRTIIIIDDVTTTGGTLNEIIRVLKKAGAKKVVGFAIAH
jgi:ComF family protein